jgi:hypothetical protein
MALSKNEKLLLISKYKKEGLTYSQIGDRIYQLEYNLKTAHQVKKFKKDFKEEFSKLWISG